MSKELIPLVKLDFSEETLKSVCDVIRTGNLVYGEVSKSLEQDFSKYIDVKFASLVNSGTSALILALKALEIGHGDEVIVPAFSYIATANVIELVGATPKFIDIQISDFNIDPSLIEDQITEKTKAIIVVHEFGQPAELEIIKRIAKKNNLKLIEDAACGLGARYKGKHVGTFGDIGTFSFHPRKAITSGDGGLIVTNDDDLSHKICLLLNHGQNRKDGKITFDFPGYNFRITEFQSQLLIEQLKELNEGLQKKKDIANFYLEELKFEKKITLPKILDDRTHAWQSFHILLEDSLDRNRIIQALLVNNIQSSLGAQCIPAEKYYEEKYKLESSRYFPNALLSNKKGIVLPLFDGLTIDEALYITMQLKKILNG